MNNEEYEKYKDYGISEFSADPIKFGNFIQFVAENKSRNEILTLLNVILEHFFSTQPENRTKILKIKELLAILLINSNFDGTFAKSMLNWKYEFEKMNSIFNFAISYSRKKFQSKNLSELQKLWDFYIFGYFIEFSIPISNEELLKNAIKNVSELFLQKSETIDPIKIAEKLYAGILVSKNNLFNKSADLDNIIENLKIILKQSDSAFRKDAEKIIEFHENSLKIPKIEELQISDFLPKIQVKSEKIEPMILEENITENFDFNIFNTNKENYEDVESLLLRTKCEQKYFFH